MTRAVLFTAPGSDYAATLQSVKDHERTKADLSLADVSGAALGPPKRALLGFLLKLYSQSRQEERLDVSSNLESPVFFNWPFLEKFNSNPMAIQLNILWKILVSPFLAVGGPMLVWIALVTLAQACVGMCPDGAWIKSKICETVCGAPTLSFATTATFLTSLASFAMYMLQAGLSIWGAMEAYKGYYAVSSHLDRATAIDKIYELILQVAGTAPSCSHGALQGPCQVYSGWGARCVAAHHVLTHPSQTEKRQLQDKVIGVLDVELARSGPKSFPKGARAKTTAQA